jgi:hypothetical protein
MSDIANSITDSLDRNGRGSMLAPFKNVDGTLALPGITFGNEPSTGIARLNTSEMTFITAATARFKVTTAGVQVIGSIIGGGNMTGIVDLTTTGSTILGDSQGDIFNVGAGGIIKDANGNTGFNVTPTNFGGYTTVEAKGKSGGAGGVFKTTSSTGTVSGEWFSLDSNGINFGSATNHPILFNINGVNKATLDTSGRLYIGTAAGVRQLNIGSVNVDMVLKSTVASGGAGTSTYYFGNSATDSIGYLSYDHSTNFLSFGVNGAERARFDSSGNLGVGSVPLFTSAGRGTLTVNGSASSVLGLGVGGVGVGSIYADAGTSSWSHSTGTLQLAAAGSTRMFIDTAGNVGIGVTPTGILDVATSTTPRVRIRSTAANATLLLMQNSVSGAASGDGFELGLLADGVTGSLWNYENGLIQFGTNNSVKLNISADGRLYGTALHNNAGAMTGTTNQYIGSGTYTPTTVAQTNVSATSGLLSNWTRVGNVVTVAFGASVTPTAGASPTTFRVPLPIASAMTGADLHGSGAGNHGATYTGGYITADNINDVALVTYVPPNNTAGTFDGIFQYTVL